MKYLDCTLRDGGYINNWNFNKKFINDYIYLMNKIEIDYVEIGFINIDNEYKNKPVNKIRNIDNEYINLFKDNNFKIVVLGDYK